MAPQMTLPCQAFVPAVGGIHKAFPNHLEKILKTLT